MSLDLSNHSHVTPKFLSQLPVLFPKLVYLSLENCKGVSQTDVFKDYALLKTLNAKGTQISETAARRLSMSVQHLEVCLKGVSFISWFSPNSGA